MLVEQTSQKRVLESSRARIRVSGSSKGGK